MLNSYRQWTLICHNPANSENYDSFVIPDYKIRKKAGPTRARGGRHFLVATGVLALTLGAVRFFDLKADNSDLIAAAEASPLLSTPLSLPDRPAQVADAAAYRSSSPDQEYTDLPLPAPQPRRPAPDPTEPSLLTMLAPPQGALQDGVETGLPAVELPDPVPVAEVPSAEPAPAQWTEHQVASGESLASIFKDQGLEPALLHRIVNSDKQAKSLAKIRPGQILRFRYDDDELTALELQRNRVESLRVEISDDHIGVEQVSKEVDKQIASASGIIESSLFLDGQKAGLSERLIMELAHIFGWDIDFALEIRAGDRFRVLYEEHYLDGEKLRDGSILAAEFTNRGKTHTAVRYENSHGEIGYYDADGHSKRRAFMRSPIKFARVSSRYNPKRWHPVLKKWRSHKGVDYAAPRGTPIRATGDGRVVHRGSKGGYGRTVIVEHAGKYTTLYAHLSKYSKRAKRGTRVKQGQVIGYVGKSGLATGPHLHYEFRVHGRHRDPLRVKLPKSLSLPKSEIASFRKAADPLLTQLAAIPADTMVASAEISGTP